jgi:hypothetical protein
MNINEQLLRQLNAEYATKDDIRDIFQHSVDQFLAELYKKNSPLSTTFQLGTQPYVVDYKNRRHIFVYNYSTTTVVLTSNDGKVINLPPQVWSNLGFQQGTSLSTTATTLLEIKCTDEVIP